ncbi:MAG TPA: helix-turn-helix transcriptional regulator, partial [bacterium]
MSLGSELKQARETRKISLETVSEKTRIPIKYLESIEENRFDIFPSHTYAKGFIRAYAKVVGVDPQ